MDDLRSFPETRWSLVARAGHAAFEDKRRALAELLGRYRPAFMKFLVVTKRTDPDLAEDLVQGFLTTKVLEKDLIARAEQAKGRFRSFLVKALQNYAIDQLRSRRRRAEVPMDEHLDAAKMSDAEDAFHLAWAQEAMRTAFRRMHVRCEASGGLALWRLFECRIIEPAHTGQPPPSYEELARGHGLRSAKQAANLLVTARRMFRRVLRSVIAEYADEDEIAEETADLKRILARAGG